MQSTIRLNLAASSINSAYYNDKRMGYNAKTKQWIQDLCKQLGYESNQSALKCIREYFNPEQHVISVEVAYFTPKFFNKQKQVSAQSMDVGNITKTLIDVIFTDAFCGSGDYKSNNLCIDDKYICSLLTTKAPAADFGFVIKLQVLDMPVASKA
jgi:hypothetical protein